MTWSIGLKRTCFCLRGGLKDDEVDLLVVVVVLLWRVVELNMLDDSLL